ncbi:hypothetical protein CHI10_10965 [Bacillus sp. 7894-2]|nr:hypothetical protein CHI10_10965 [Bacillus sp. 7894-2]
MTHTTPDKTKKGADENMGRTKRGNGNAQRNNNKHRPQRTSEELVEFTTGSKERKENNVQD